MKMLQVRFLEVVVGAPGLAAQVTAERLLVTLGPVAVPGVCGTPGWRGRKMCISVESHDGSASSWPSCPLQSRRTFKKGVLSFSCLQRRVFHFPSRQLREIGAKETVFASDTEDGPAVGCFWLERDILTFSSVHPPKEHSAPLLPSAGDCF